MNHVSELYYIKKSGPITGNWLSGALQGPLKLLNSYFLRDVDVDERYERHNYNPLKYTQQMHVPLVHRSKSHTHPIVRVGAVGKRIFEHVRQCVADGNPCFFVTVEGLHDLGSRLYQSIFWWVLKQYGFFKKILRNYFDKS